MTPKIELIMMAARTPSLRTWLGLASIRGEENPIVAFRQASVVVLGLVRKTRCRITIVIQQECERACSVVLHRLFRLSRPALEVPKVF
jgi:hypothetical protein